MSTVPLVAVRAFPYAGGSVVAGQVFVAQSDQDATLLKAIGHAVDAPAWVADDDQEPRPPTRTRRRKPAEDV